MYLIVKLEVLISKLASLLLDPHELYLQLMVILLTISIAVFTPGCRAERAAYLLEQVQFAFIVTLSEVMVSLVGGAFPASLRQPAFIAGFPWISSA